MIRVGLTGNVASGKSAVAEIWQRAGVPVLSADELARSVVSPGGPAEAEVRRTFGDQAFSRDGTLDRGRMRALVFQDPKERNRLEGILHPHIRALTGAWLDARRSEGAPLVVNEVPLLFEAGMEDEFDVIVVVDAPEGERERRLESARGIPVEEARQIMAAQGDPSAKRNRADYVLDNAGSLEALEASALALLGRLRAKATAEGEG